MFKILLAGAAMLMYSSAFADPVDSLGSDHVPPDSIAATFKSQADSLDQNLQFHTGKLHFTEAFLRMKVPDGHLFLDAAQTNYILETLWGNPHDPEILGMIVRSDFQPGAISNDYSFVISYSPIGYLPTQKETSFDHKALLEAIQEQLQEANEKRLALGFNALQTENWVMVPYFDQYKKALYWATELRVNGSEESLINYNLRVLGKKGVLKINAVGTMDQLPAIKKALPYLLAQTSFEEGFQYFDQETEAGEISDWTLEELIVGKKSSGIFGWSSATFFALAIILGGGIFLSYRILRLKLPALKATA